MRNLSLDMLSTLFQESRLCLRLEPFYAHIFIDIATVSIKFMQPFLGNMFHTRLPGIFVLKIFCGVL